MILEFAILEAFLVPFLSRAMHAQGEGNIDAPNFRVFDFRETRCECEI